MDTLITELIELVKQTAPELWRIASRQVLVHAVQCSIGLIVAILVLVGCWKAYKKIATWSSKKKRDYYDDQMGVWPAYTCIGILAILAFMLGLDMINNLIGFAINPEYYAIKELLALVK